MTGFFLVSLALAEPPPEPPEAAELLRRAKEGVAAMSGCFVMRGEANDHWNAGILGKGSRRVAVGGTLEGGLWHHAFAEALDGQPLGKEETRGSLFGRYPNPDSGEEKGRVSLAAALEGEVAMEWAEPLPGGGWRLVHTLAGGKAAKNELSVEFTAALRPTRWRIDIVDPLPVKGDKGRATIRQMHLEMVVAEDGAPLTETMEGDFAAWPWVVQAGGTVTWSHEACPVILGPATEAR